MSNTRMFDAYDYKSEGRDIEVKLLRALAMGGKRSVEIQLLLDSQAGDKADYQALSLLLADISVQEKRAQATFEKLRAHQARMNQKLGRAVGVKTAAMDYLENIERALNLKDDEQVLTYNQLAQMAFRDDLTGLANFRYFTRRFSEETKRAGRYSHLLSMLMIDIDFFKRFNDQHGHLSGNKALEHLAKILLAETRETDLVARYGGEEFAIILPETTKHETRELAERIRQKVEKSAIELSDGPPQLLTISVGLATFPRDAESPEALLAAADEALYASKKAGRNRVSLHKPGTSALLSFTPESVSAAHSMSVMGDFNGWDKTADPMERDSQGRFFARLHLAPGRYTYKFVINGTWYLADPLSNEFVLDGYGGRNSVLIVKK
jgi:diguanylate cyclase (GGDEF)-like protein